jgi:hypothetical protein
MVFCTLCPRKSLPHFGNLISSKVSWGISWNSARHKSEPGSGNFAGPWFDVSFSSEFVLAWYTDPRDQRGFFMLFFRENPCHPRLRVRRVTTPGHAVRRHGDLRSLFGGVGRPTSNRGQPPPLSTAPATCPCTSRRSALARLNTGG